jgi:hypothetical protein
MSKLCFLCGKKIGFVRTFWDQHYCSAEHRREARLASSQALREEEEVESWTVERSRKRQKPVGAGPTAGQTASAFAFLTVVGLLVVAVLLPGPGGRADSPLGISLDSGSKRGMMDRVGDFVSDMVREKAPITLHHDFRLGLQDWTTVALTTGSKLDDPHTAQLASLTAPELVRPGSLRIWDKSISLQNYQMEFLGEMDKKSLSWAFRATDPKNFYATKIVMNKPGPQPNADLVRYVMMNGHEWDRVQLPLPVTLERGVNYRVRVSVQDDHFVTYLNGQVISSWSDKRLHRGGIGFFSEDEDTQKVAWVSVSERDSFVGRMLSHFSLIVLPPSLTGGLTPSR